MKKEGIIILILLLALPFFQASTNFHSAQAIRIELNQKQMNFNAAVLSQRFLPPYEKDSPVSDQEKIDEQIKEFHKSEEIYLYLNSTLITLKDAIDQEKLCCIGCNATNDKQIKFGHFANEIKLIINQETKNLQQLIDEQYFCLKEPEIILPEIECEEFEKFSPFSSLTYSTNDFKTKYPGNINKIASEGKMGPSGGGLLRAYGTNDEYCGGFYYIIWENQLIWMSSDIIYNYGSPCTELVLNPPKEIIINEHNYTFSSLLDYSKTYTSQGGGWAMIGGEETVNNYYQVCRTKL